MLARAAATTGSALAESAQAAQAPVSPNQPPDILIARIAATAFGPSNARVTKSAIVRVGAMLPGGYAGLAWGGSGFD